MQRIRRRIREARKKLAHIAGGIALADRRIRHFERRFNHYRPGSPNRERARKSLARWRRRRRYLLFLKAEWEDRLDRRRRAKKKWLKDHPPPKPQTGWGTWSGKSVPAWMVPWLEKSVAHGWRGYVTSGIRTPEYSEQLCYGMCGAPSCPGRCAGRSSNHNCTQECPYPTGALDVTDYYNFGEIQREIGSPLKNALGAQDPVHFSVSGR